MILFRGGGGSVIYRAKLLKIIPIYTSNLKKKKIWEGGGGLRNCPQNLVCLVPVYERCEKHKRSTCTLIRTSLPCSRKTKGLL